MHVFTDIPCQFDLPALRRDLCIEPGTAEAESLKELVVEAQARARPKALFMESFIESRSGDALTIDGISFQSRMLQGLLQGVQRVFPFVTTCGSELDEIEVESDDILRKFWLESLKNAALECSRRFLQTAVAEKFGLYKASNLSPGSGDESVWPLEQQRRLFDLLGDVQGLIGVRLTPSCLMLPTKSLSGIRFPTAVEFRSCQLCRRSDCPLRRAPFDQSLWDALQETGSCWMPFDRHR